ncbi:hypothetical protein GH733_016932 [Mirounga leonina]|nr:hypothetical protein GH733_016932 [Mirounga leonina]
MPWRACKRGAKEGAFVGDWGGCFLGPAKWRGGVGGRWRAGPHQIQSPFLASPGPGSLRCPVCLSTEHCESATERPAQPGARTATVGQSGSGKVSQDRGSPVVHGMRRSLRTKIGFSGEGQKLGPEEGGSPGGGVVLAASPSLPRSTGDSFSVLRVQGCTLTCQQGVMLYSNQNLSQTPLRWTTDHYELCNVGEVCQETLLLVDVGTTQINHRRKQRLQQGQEAGYLYVTVHSGPPGVLVASCAHFCPFNRCNRASNTSVLLNSLPRPAAPAPGNLQCPVCVNIFGSCPENPQNVMCPSGTTQCYSGYIQIQEASSSLLNHVRKIGVFSVTENPEEKLDVILQAGAAPVPLLAWVVGLGLSLALWCGMPLC